MQMSMAVHKHINLESVKYVDLNKEGQSMVQKCYFNTGQGLINYD